MMKKVYIIHGWKGTPESNWFPWLKEELEKKGVKVFVPQLPNTLNPDLKSWLLFVQKYITDPDEDTILVGHSVGCITILRYLESIDKKIKASILVAGFARDLEYEGYKGEVSSFFKNSINWKKVRRNCGKFIAFHSKNDPFVSIYNSDLFRENLSAETIVDKAMGHYNEGAGVRVFPRLLNLIIKL